MRDGVFRRCFHTSRALQGFRRLIRPPIDISKLKLSKDELPVFVSTTWQHEGDEQVIRWVRRADGTILKLQSITRMDIDLLDHADAQEPAVYISLIQECGNARALADGKRVHAHLSKAGLHKDSFVANFLLNMYGKCGSMKDAEQVLEAMLCPNVISWNIMITAYARNGHLEAAKSMFDGMPNRTLVSWNSIITAYSQESNIGAARAVFDRMPYWSEVSWTTLMAAYAQNGDLLEATSFFNRMPVRDLVAWTTIIRAHALKGLYREALCLFRKLRLEGLKPDKVTLLTILESCDNRIDGASIHASIIEQGLQTDVAVGTALINMYGRCGCLETARKIFVKIEDKDVVAWTAMVNAYADNGHLEVSRLMLERMPIKNSVSWNVVITAYARSGHLREAKEMFDWLTEKDAVTWTTLITAYAQKGMSKKSLELFRLMVVDGIAMDRVTLIAMLYVCAAVTALKVGEAIHDHILHSKLAVDGCLWTALMNMYGRCGNVEQAHSLFESNRQKDIVSWNCMIQVYGQNGLGRQALQLHAAMVHEGIKWNDLTSINVLSACSHSGLDRQGRAFFAAMQDDYGIDHSAEHYICMVDLLARCGRVSDARDLLDSMPFEPHAAAWTSYFAACKSQGKLEKIEDINHVASSSTSSAAVS